MPTTPSPSLVGYLREQSRLAQSLVPVFGQWSAPQPDSVSACPPFRVPLQLDGSIWSAEVMDVSDDNLRLAVDREAVGDLHAEGEACIRFQPENGFAQEAVGRIAFRRLLGANRVELEFAMS